MNRPVLSDDDLVALLERTMQRVADLAPTLPIEEPRASRWPVTAAAAAVAVVGIGGSLVLVDRSADGPAASVPGTTTQSAAPIDTAAPTGTTPAGTPTEGEPRWARGTDPAAFPSDVPLPDDVETVNPMEWDQLRVGWEFLGQQDPSSGTERCASYSELFDDTWTSTPDTDEHPSAIFAHHYTNDDWDVGIYCVDNGDFVVQVLSLNATTTVPPTSA